MGGGRVVDDPELSAQVRSMRASGATYAQIKAELGIGASTISRILGVYGKGRAKPRVTDDVKERARVLRRDGRSVPEIATELGLAKSTAWLITKDIAWTPGPDGASRRATAAREYWRKEQREAHRGTHTCDGGGRCTGRRDYRPRTSADWSGGVLGGGV